MPNASQIILRTKQDEVAEKPQTNWLLRRCINDLALNGEFRWAAIKAEYERRLELVRVAA